MLQRILLLFSFFIAPEVTLHAQADSSYLFNPATPYGTLDVRIARSDSDFYYLREGETFSFREVNGLRTNTFVDMTAWDSDKYAEGHMRERSGDDDRFVMNYRILAPEGYDANYSSGYPLVILLHGLMEGGNCSDKRCYHASRQYSPNENQPPAPTDINSQLLNNDYNLVHGGSNYLEAHSISGSSFPDDPELPPRAFPGFVVFPQNLNGWDAPAAEDAIRLVRLLTKKYNVDQNRIYINGVSNGGRGTYEVIKRAPWLFAAAVLFSAADDASIIAQNSVKNMMNVPLWIFQGGADVKPTQKQTEEYVSRFRDAGVKVRYTLYPELGHGTWNKAFAEPDFFSWMLRQRKNNLRIDGQRAVICKPSGEGARLTMPQGFVGYEWEFNGMVISGAKGPEYIADKVGLYRGRFAVSTANGAVWNNWSPHVEVTEKELLPVELRQRTTLLLRDPNGSNEAVLEAAGDYMHFYWYKNGVPIDYGEDTARFARLAERYGDGSYAVRAAGDDGCSTPPSAVRRIVFSDKAPVTLASPTGLSGDVISPSEIRLRWRDNSDEETGFEIWRRRKIGDNKFTSWHMTTLTGAGVTSFEDRALVPSSTYQYIIRAVSDTARSEYSTIGAPLEVTTMTDTDKPSAPRNLVANVSGIRRIGLHWRPSTDNSSVLRYRIYYNGDTVSTAGNDTTFTISAAEINKNYDIHVTAIDAGNNESDGSNVVQVNTHVKGLYYQHSTGAWESLNEIDWSIAEFTGVVDNITLSPKTQEDFFNFRFDGYLTIRHSGVYQFRISSDDGSMLFLDDSVLVENDGVHNLATETSPVQLLTSGAHRFTVAFFDYVSSDSLLVEYKGPDSKNEWLQIPSEAFSSDIVTNIEPREAEEVVSVYPNPFRQYSNLKIQFKTVDNGLVSFSLLSALGEEVHHQQTMPDSGLTYTLSLREKLDNGVYFLRIATSRKEVYIKRIVLMEAD